MGIRSLTHIKGNDNESVLVTIYRQMDGYPKGMGADLKAIVGNITVVNGYSLTQKLPAHANGMGCVAAYVIGKLSGWSIGSIYIETPGASDCGEEYVYTLYQIGKRVGMKAEKAEWRETMQEVNGRYVERKRPIVHPAVTLYDGLAADFDPAACEPAEAA